VKPRIFSIILWGGLQARPIHNRFSEVEFESELSVARQVVLWADVAEGAAVEGYIGQTEIDFVEQVESLGVCYPLHL
jgi:hypothetical protein